MLSRATRAGADLALVALAVLACWQLRRYSAVSTSAGSPSVIDPVLLLAPALALAAGTVLTLRLLPIAARAVDRVSAAGRGLTSALAGWQFSRQPLRQGGPALLLVMAVGTGTLALAQHQSWTRSAADQAAYVTGADAQVNLASPVPAGATTSITGAAGVRAAMAVSAVQEATPAQVVAIDAAQAPKVALLRADQSSLPPAALLRSITPSSPSGGLLISGRPQSVHFTVTLSRAPLGPVTAQFTVTDATGAAFQLSSALFSADGRPHVLTASLGGTGAAYPLRLSQVTLFYILPAKPLKTPVTLTVAGATPSTWTAAASSPQLVSELSTDNMYGPSAGPRVTSWQRAPRGATLTFTPGYGRWSQAPGASPVLTEPVAGQVSLSAPNTLTAVVPAIATRAFDSANNTGVGSIVQTTVNGTTVPAKIVAVASAFPTIAGAGLVMDLSTLEAFLVSHGTAPVAVTQWWLATADGQVPASLTRALPSGATTKSSAALAAATVADPLSAAPQQALLAMTVAAALLAIFGFWVSIAANVRQRRAENAVLAALGVSQRCAATQLFLEKLLLSVPRPRLACSSARWSPGCWCPRSLSAPPRRHRCRRRSLCSTCRRRSRSRPRSPCFPHWPPRSSSSGAPTQPPNSARRRQREPAIPAQGAVPLAGPAHLPRGFRGHRRRTGDPRQQDPGGAPDARRHPPTTRTINVSAAWNDVQKVLSFDNNAIVIRPSCRRPRSTRSPASCTPTSTAPRSASPRPAPTGRR